MIESAWFHKYKPESIDDYVFENEEQYQIVESWISSGRIDGNLILYGPPGTGKTALCEILIKNIIKHQMDIKKISTRSVSDIDLLYEWIIKKPIKSKIKIVYFEEFDKISRQAMFQLKDGLMEKYQDYVSFIATTNHIRRIDQAVLTRFNYKFEFKGDNEYGYLMKAKQILESENVKYKDEDLEMIVSKLKRRGLREIINFIQINSVNGFLNITGNISPVQMNEDEIVNIIIEIINHVLEIKNSNDRFLILFYPAKSSIRDKYVRLLDLINSDYEIDYEYIFDELFNSINYLPIKSIINSYINNLDNFRYRNIMFISFFYDVVKCILNVYL
ncbi:MAG: AAA family ATPase [Candidatus Anstonellales archaeon]